MSLTTTTPAMNTVNAAARKIRANWSTRERDLRRRLARLRTQVILQLIDNSLATAN